jgi:hypothetical protein
LNVDDDFRFTQFFAEVLILATELLVLLAEGTALGLGAAFLWRQGMQNSGSSFLPPGHHVRGVQALAPEQGANTTSLLLGPVGLSQNALLVLGREASALGTANDLGVGAFVLASLGLTALCRQGRRGCLRILHAEIPSRPAL